MVDKVSVIVLSYNSKQYLGVCLESLRQLIYNNYEVILFDNASTDASVEYVQTNYPWVKLVRSTLNLGYAAGNNQAAREAEGDYFLFLNPDTWVKPDVLHVLVSKAKSNPKAGICACTQISYDGKKGYHGQTRLNCGLTTDFLGYPIALDKSQKILYADGASLFIRKEAFQRVGGFDSEFFMYSEDVDLCWRVLLAGFDVVPAEDAFVGHRSGGTSIRQGQNYQINKNRRYFVERNSLRTILKNYSALFLTCILPLRLTIMFLQMLTLLALRQGQFAMVQIQAIAWNLRNLKETFMLREAIQSNRQISDVAIMSRMNKHLGLATSFTAVRQGSTKMGWKK